MGDYTFRSEPAPCEERRAIPVRFKAGVPGRDGRNGKDGFSPTVVVERIEDTSGGLVMEDSAGNRWSFPDGAGTGDDITITDGAGNLWHMPAGAATGGEIPIDDGSGGAWHIPVGGTGGRSGQRITITDASGEHVFYIWDGRDGGGGGSLPDGGTDGQYLVKDSTSPGGARWDDLPTWEPTESAWSVTPLVRAETTLNTAGSYLDRDIVVQEIPYAEVSNQKGGKTATIGG